MVPQSNYHPQRACFSGPFENSSLSITLVTLVTPLKASLFYPCAEINALVKYNQKGSVGYLAGKKLPCQIQGTILVKG